jgi:hypothetical protein
MNEKKEKRAIPTWLVAAHDEEISYICQTVILTSLLDQHGVPYRPDIAEKKKIFDAILAEKRDDGDTVIKVEGDILLSTKWKKIETPEEIKKKMEKQIGERN